MAKKEALGKGLGALLQQTGAAVDYKRQETADNGKEIVSNITTIRLSDIELNPHQPRKTFSEKHIEELAASIKSVGLITPISVRKVSDNKYQLISGECRIRAFKTLGLTEITAYIKEDIKSSASDMLIMGLIENIQRADLNPIDEAFGYLGIKDLEKISDEEVGKKVGKPRSTITNHLRLLTLPSEVQTSIKDGLISMGHAKAFIKLKDDEQKIKLVHQIVEKGLSVRQVEELVNSIENEDINDDTISKKLNKDQTIYTEQIEELAKKLNTKVSIKANNGKGNITIHFSSEEELNRILKSF